MKLTHPFGEVDSRGRVFSGHASDEAVREAAAALAGAAHEAGYFGPAGLDSLLFRMPAEGGAPAREVLRPVVEWNARFTLGIVTVGIVRRALPALRAELGLEPGERRAFLFATDLPDGWESWQAICEARDEALQRVVPLWTQRDTTRPALVVGRDLAALRSLVHSSAAPSSGRLAAAPPPRQTR